MSIQKSQKLSTQSSKPTSVSNGSRNSSGLIRLSFLELQQALDKENKVYKSFKSHTNVLELINVYELLKNSKVSFVFINAWMWYSWKKVERKKSHIEGQRDHLEGEVGNENSIEALFNPPHKVLFKASSEGKVEEDGLSIIKVKETTYPKGEGKAFLGMNIYYFGEFRNGLLHGKGLLQWKDDNGNLFSYKGTFFYNCLHEHGEYNWHRRGAYVGKIFDGFPNKFGIMQEGKCGHVYDGNFIYGLREGLGKMIYKDGKDVPNYIGEWIQDQKHGQGRYLYEFATYQGEWIHGKRGGIGIQTQMVDKKKMNPLHVPIFAASVYEGTWFHGFPHGRGKHIWTWNHNKETFGLLHNAYVGDFEHGMRSKRGTFYYASGAIYQGYWKNNYKDGHGLYTYEDGRLQKVLCHTDRFQFHDERTIMILVKHALDSVMDEDVDIESLKLKLLYLTLRFTNTFKSTFHTYSAFSAYASKFNSTKEKRKFDLTIEDINNDEELREGALEEPFLLPPSKIQQVPLDFAKGPIEYQRDENGNPILDENRNPIPILVVERLPLDNIDPAELKIALKKYRLSKTASTNFNLKQDFKDEVSKSYLKFIVKYICGGEKRDTLFGDALDNVDDNLYYIYRNLRLEGQVYAMTMENFWRLCYDAHIVEPGLGLGQIDAIIHPPSNAWDDAFDLYCPKRQLIHREVIENLVKIGLCKYFGHGMQVDKKLQDFFNHCFNKIENKDDDSIYKFLMEQPTQDCILEFEPHFRSLFGKYLLRSKTNTFCIKLDHIIHLFKDVIYDQVYVSQEFIPLKGAPQGAPLVVVPPINVLQGGAPLAKIHKHDLFQDSILAVVSQTLYQTKFQSKSDPHLYLDLEINFKEFELILVKFALLKFAPHKQLEDGNPMKEHAQRIQKFMNYISELCPKPPTPVEEELELLDEELQESEQS